MVQKHGAQMSHQTSEYSPSSTNAYAEFVGSGGQTATTRSNLAANESTTSIPAY